MDVREKLVEIVKNAGYYCLPINTQDRHINMFVTDLLSHGVTVQECKVGDVVYCLYQECQNETKIIELEVETIEIHKDYTVLQGFIGEHCYRYLTKEIGKAVFLTKEQAEAHLPQPPKGE